MECSTQHTIIRSDISALAETSTTTNGRTPRRTRTKEPDELPQITTPSKSTKKARAPVSTKSTQKRGSEEVDQEGPITPTKPKRRKVEAVAIDENSRADAMYDVEQQPPVKKPTKAPEPIEVDESQVEEEDLPGSRRFRPVLLDTQQWKARDTRHAAVYDERLKKWKEKMVAMGLTHPLVNS